MSRTVSTRCVICAPDDGRLGSVDDIAAPSLGPPVARRHRRQCYGLTSAHNQALAPSRSWVARGRRVRSGAVTVHAMGTTTGTKAKPTPSARRDEILAIAAAIF